MYRATVSSHLGFGGEGPSASRQPMNKLMVEINTSRRLESWGDWNGMTIQTHMKGKSITKRRGHW